MPLKKSDPYCVNHPDEKMLQNSGFNAIIALKKEVDGKVQFMLDSGVPVVVFFCDKCGYVETYAAQYTAVWKSAP